MTEQIKSAIEKLKGFYMNDSCHEDFNECICYECKEHCEDGKPIILAINSLNAWEEVLQELEHEKEICFAYDSDEGFVYARVIEKINQHFMESWLTMAEQQ